MQEAALELHEKEDGHSDTKTNADIQDASVIAQSNGPLSVEEMEKSSYKLATMEQSIPESKPVSSTPLADLPIGSGEGAMKQEQIVSDGTHASTPPMIDYSLRVRTKYQYGTDEIPTEQTVANDSRPVSNATSLPTIIIPDTDDSVRTEALSVSRSGTQSAMSFHRGPTEVAGGIEDWTDMDDAEVDRYGFIQPITKTSARNGDSISLPGQGVQRVATSLRLASGTIRSKRRSRVGLNTARSLHSLPIRPSSEGDGRQSSASIRSAPRPLSTRHSVNPFRSRYQRAVDVAPDMLTFSSELFDIDEYEDPNVITVPPMKKREWQREEKWRRMARQVHRPRKDKGGGMNFVFDSLDRKVISRTWKGIPDRWRSTAWHSFLSTSAQRRGCKVTDDQLIEEFHRLQDLGSRDDEQIDLDVPRTVNLHVMFRRRYRGGQRLLFRVLHAISLYFEHVGYVQGMGSLAATLLCYYDEERAFVMMVRLWQVRGLEQLFQAEFQGLMTALDEFEKSWLGQGAVAKKLVELDIAPTAYGTRWYLTLFNMSMPFSAQLRVWDVFMLLGDAHDKKAGLAFGGADLDVLHATSAALIDATQEIVLESDFENAMKVLTSFVPIQDEDVMMRVVRAEWRQRKKRWG